MVLPGYADEVRDNYRSRDRPDNALHAVAGGDQYQRTDQLDNDFEKKVDCERHEIISALHEATAGPQRYVKHRAGGKDFDQQRRWEIEIVRNRRTRARK